MITIKEVKTRKEKKQFLRFPDRLYRHDKFYVPNLYLDEKSCLNRKSPYEEVCDSAFFLAYDGENVVGRIQTIIQKEYNRIHREKRVRFTRFDSIDDIEVSSALFKAAEDWAKERGMDTICGPLGYSDFEREGLLIEGFDQRQTFEEQYNYPYYPKLVEAYGFRKEIDWIESVLRAPEHEDKNMKHLANKLLERNHLRVVDNRMRKKKFIRRYGRGFFDCIEESYRELYGTVPFTQKMRDEIIRVFFPIIDLKGTCFIVDEADRVVGCAIMFPGISEAVQKSRGHLTPLGVFRLLRAIRHPKVLDLGLIGIRPEYRNSGITAVCFAGLWECFRSLKVDHMETNLNLEDNFAIRNMWKRFDHVENKRRRCYVKKI